MDPSVEESSIEEPSVEDSSADLEEPSIDDPLLEEGSSGHLLSVEEPSMDKIGSPYSNQEILCCCI